MHLMGWGLATLSFDRYKIAHTLLGEKLYFIFRNFSWNKQNYTYPRY